MTIRLILLSSLLCATPPPAEAGSATLSFSDRGRLLATRDLEELRERGSVVEVRVHEPYEDREARFLAISLSAILDAVYSPSWRTRRDTLLLVTCKDGYQPVLPLVRVASHSAWLAFDRLDADGFSIDKLESGRVQRIDLAPFYLVWKNIGNSRLLAERDYGWPYQVIGLELIEIAERFPNMVPPAAASESVRAGFAAYQVHCSRCHKMNGDGGSIGPELNPTPSPLPVLGRSWLRRWIDDPGEMLPSSRMPRFNPTEPDRAEAIERIIDYLLAMAQEPRGSAVAH